MASPRSAGENGSGDDADAVGDAFQLVAQGMAQLQVALRQQKQEAERKVQEALHLHKQEAERKVQEAERKFQEAENRMQEALRLQEERAATALREVERMLQEKDDAIRALQQRLKETQERVTAVEERWTALEGSGAEGLQRIEGRVNEVEASLQRAVQKFLPRVETLLCHVEKPQSTRASLATAASTSTASAREAPASGGAAAGGGREPPSTPTPTPSEAGYQDAAADEEERAWQGVELGQQLRDAARIGRLSDVKRLLDSGADVNYTDGVGSTPLLKAALNAHAEVVSVLLQRGADPNAVDCMCDSALHFAAGKDPSGRCVELLVRAGADVNANDEDGETPLHRAARMDHSGRCVELLVRAGADVNAGDEKGETPLHKAACSDNRGRCVELLVRAGADVNARSWNGENPLHWAAYDNNEEAVRALLAAGARRDLRACGGWWKNKTPLDLATSRAVQNLLRG